METQNKLSIEHIAKRLPYGMKFISTMDKPIEEFGKNPIWTFNGINEIFGDKCLLTKENNDAYAIQTSKTILFPIICLTESITVNGKTSVPIIEILKKASLFDLSDCTFDVYLEDNHLYVNAENKGRVTDSLYYDFNLFHSMNNDLGYNPTDPQSELQDLLLEFNIDLPHENLIEKGLAISVFDLTENPYS